MAAPETSPSPDFIKFLFSSKPKFDCYFLVGRKSLIKPERIGAVKMMLMAHSVVLRTELEDSELAEKGDVLVDDIYPDTFRSLLKFVYGYDIIGDLGFDEADNMLYAAEKYLMSSLKKKLALRLMSLLTPDNVCCLLNNPVCYTQLELHSAITEILRYETDRVLDSPSFLDVSVAGLVDILKQDGLAVPEIQLWRAAVKWAKHRVDSQDGKVLRQELSKVSKHLKICTLTGDEFCEEVAPTQVLTSDEVNLVCQSIGRKRKLSELTGFSNETKPRKRLHRLITFWRNPDCSTTGLEKQFELKLADEISETYDVTTYSFDVFTKYAVKLLPLVCSAQSCQEMEPERWTYKMDCKILIFKDDSPEEVDPAPISIVFSADVEYGRNFEIPLAVRGNAVILLPNSHYRVEIYMKSKHLAFCNFYKESPDMHESDHLSLVHWMPGDAVGVPPPRPTSSTSTVPVSPSHSQRSPSFSPTSSASSHTPFRRSPFRRSPSPQQHTRYVKWFPFKSIFYRVVLPQRLLRQR